MMVYSLGIACVLEAFSNARYIMNALRDNKRVLLRLDSYHTRSLRKRGSDFLRHTRRDFSREVKPFLGLLRGIESVFEDSEASKQLDHPLRAAARARARARYAAETVSTQAASKATPSFVSKLRARLTGKPLDAAEEDEALHELSWDAVKADLSKEVELLNANKVKKSARAQKQAVRRLSVQLKRAEDQAATLEKIGYGGSVLGGDMGGLPPAPEPSREGHFGAPSGPFVCAGGRCTLEAVAHTAVGTHGRYAPGRRTPRFGSLRELLNC